MIASKPLLIASLLCIIGFAGCVGDDPAKPAETTEPTSTVAVGSNETADVGAIEGTVRDIEHAPIGGVDVHIHTTEIVVTTDDAGHFAFTDVPVGSYDILTNRLGFENGGQRVEVLSGETSLANFTLNPIVIAPDPYQAVQTFEGLMSCGAVLVPWCGVTDEASQDYGTPNPTEEHWLFRWVYGHSIVPTTVVFELVWTPSAPETAKEFTMLATDGFDASATGASVLKLVVDGDEFDEILEDAETRFGIGVYPGIEPAINQRFTLYRTDFFYGEAPEDYSVLNNG